MLIDTEAIWLSEKKIYENSIPAIQVFYGSPQLRYKCESDILIVKYNASNIEYNLNKEKLNTEQIMRRFDELPSFAKEVIYRTEMQYGENDKFIDFLKDKNKENSAKSRKTDYER